MAYEIQNLKKIAEGQLDFREPFDLSSSEDKKFTWSFDHFCLADNISCREIVPYFFDFNLHL